MSRERLALTAHRAAAWAAPVVLGFALAYQWLVNPWPVAFIATGTAALGVLVALIVDDFRMLQLRRTWGSLLVEYRDAAIDAGQGWVCAAAYTDELVAAVLELHRSRWPAVHETTTGVELEPEVVHYDVVYGAVSMPDAHECITDLVRVVGLGYLKCDPLAGVHVIEACCVCGTQWPCATALAVTPRTCKHCGCSDLLACGGGCTWVSEDECSACAPATVSVTIDVDTSAFTRAMDAVATTTAAAAEGMQAISADMAAAQGGAA